MTESKRWLTYKIIVLYCFLASGQASLTLGDNPYIDLLLSVLGIIILPKSYVEVRPTKKAAAWFLALSVLYTMIGGSIFGYFGQLSMILIPCQLIFLKSKCQIDLFNWLSKWYAILLTLSFLWWVIWLLGIPLPHTSEQIEWENDDYGCIIENYYLFRNVIWLNPYETIVSLFRFKGFFLEPGHVGTITSLFLIINKFNLKDWRNKVFFLIILASFSAAAYALTFIAYCMYRLNFSKAQVLMPIFCISIAILVIMSYNGGDNPINEVIIGKFMRDSGAVEGRFSTETQLLWDQICSDGRILFGVGAWAYLPQSAGYKVFLIKHGIVGATITVICYWLILRCNNSKYGRYLFILMLISFLQRAYCFWDAFLDPYILGTAVFRHSKLTASFDKDQT